MFEEGGTSKKKNPEADLTRIKWKCRQFQKIMKKKIEQDELNLKKLIEFGKKAGMIKGYDHMKLLGWLHSGNDRVVMEAAVQMRLILHDMEDPKKIDSIETGLGIALKDTMNPEVAKCLIDALKIIAKRSKSAEDRIKWASGLHPSEKIREIAKQAARTVPIRKRNEAYEKEEWKRKFKEKVNSYRIKNGKKPIEPAPGIETKKDEREEFKTRVCNALSMVASVHSCENYCRVYKQVESELGPEELEILMKIAKETESKELMLPVKVLNSIGIDMAIRLLRAEGRLLPDLSKYARQ